MRYASLFTGIGGFDLGFDRAGMECVWQCEREPSCNNVLERQWPGMVRVTDVRDVSAANGLVRPDWICGGFPCQDLSVAGRRAELAGERSGLFFEFMRIVREFAPAGVVIENVPGLLSSNGGDDMAVVLRSLAELGHGFAYRILDAQWLGVAQRRRRVFIVGCLGDWRRAAEILFERESLPWDSAPSREAGTRIAASLTRGAESGGKGGYALNCGTDPNQNIVAGFKRGQGTKARSDGWQPEQSPTLTSSDSGTQQSPGVQIGRVVRRLTPRECERLQGFPDDWTRYGADDKEISDSARYRMLGNAVAVPVAEWIGRRIVESTV